MKDLLTNIGKETREFLAWFGGMTTVLFRTLWVGPRPPLGLRDIVEQMMVITVRSIPMATLMSLFIGMILAWQFGQALTDFGAKNALGYTSAYALVRELVPTILALTVGVKMASGMTAELGSMKVTEQIDAIAALGADPIKKLIWPRLVAATLGLPLLVAWGNLVALGGGMIISDTVFNVPSGYFYSTYVSVLVTNDYVSSITKGFVFGGIAGTIGCYQGFTTRYGTEAVGIATTETVVAVAISVLVADFGLTTLFLPI